MSKQTIPENDKDDRSRVAPPDVAGAHGDLPRSGHGAIPTLTADQALAHLEAMLNGWRMAANDSRSRGEEYKASANAAEDAHLQRVQFEESSRFFAYAREIDRDAQALSMVLVAAKATPDLLEACRDYLERHERNRSLRFCWGEMKAAVAKAEGR